jgi:regulator of sirC expression with transglutaminase-like and TPR domain
MDNQKEITALLHLLEDPDLEVFDAVSNRLFSYGLPIIRELEILWENTIDNELQDKIEHLIHQLHFFVLLTDFEEWGKAPHRELLPGLLLVSKFLFPDLKTAEVIRDIERLKRNIWLELNNYLTPVEQIHVLNSILYNYFGLKGNYNNSTSPNEFLIHQIIESKKGNQSGNGSLYLLLCELLDIPVKLISVPNQFILAYMKPGSGENRSSLHLNIDFFIDPVTGQPFTHNDLNNYFSRMHLPVLPEYFLPKNNRQIIKRLLEDFSLCFGDENKQYMQKEIQQLILILD